MTLQEARKILGLGPDDDPRPFLAEFKEARERIAEMVRSAPNDTLAARYQQGLTDFDQALAAVREYLEALGLAPKSTESVIPDTPPPAPAQLDPLPAPVIEAVAPVLPESQETTPEAISPPKIEPPKIEVEKPEAPKVEAPVVETPKIETPKVEFFTVPAAPAAAQEPAPAPESSPKEEPAAPSEPAPKSEPAFVFKPAESLPASAPPIGKASSEPKKTQPAKTAPLEDQPPKATAKKRSMKAVWLLTAVLLAIAGGLFYLHTEKTRKEQTQLRLATLEKLGAGYIENRNWPEAKAVFDEIETLDPRSDLIGLGRRSIEAGMTEEQNQFVGYWTGQAKASLEAKRWDEAAAAAKQVLDRFPNEDEPREIIKQIEAAKAAEANKMAIEKARGLLSQRQWDEAIAAANKILSDRPADEDAKSLLADATAAKEKASADLLRAKNLISQAKTRDKGQYDAEVVEWVRQAAALAPEDPEIKGYLEKISSYARTLRVPGDFATPAEALSKANDRDRIIVTAGTWEGPLVINHAIDLQGSGPDDCIVQCLAQAGNAITLGPGARGARISGFTFRHQSFDPGEERFSAALVRGVQVDLSNCRFLDGSGHGLAVIEGGHAVVSRCRFADNGWDGIAASGAGSLLEVRDSESLRNFGHGIQSWDGAAVILTGNRCEENSRNGIHADNGGGSVTLERNLLANNREFGLVISSAGSGRASGNAARGNLLGGYAIRAAASAVAFSGNEASRNEGPGLVLDTGILPGGYSGNTNVGNAGQQVLTNANLTVKDEPAPAEDAPANPTTPPKAKPVLEGE